MTTPPNEGRLEASKQPQSDENPRPEEGKAEDFGMVSGRAGQFPDWMSTEHIGRVSALAAVVAYAAGLLIVNMYLFQIGVTDFSVLRTRFILTGVLAAIPIAALILLVVAVIAVVDGVAAKRRELKAKGQRMSWITLVIGIVFPAAALVLFLGGVITEADIDLGASIFPSEIFYIATFVLVIDMLVTHSLVLSGWVRGSSYRKPTGIQKVSLTFATIMVEVVLIFMYMDFFAATIFHRVPEQFGGGRPKAVEVVLSESSDALGATVGFEQAKEGLTTRHVDLLWETEQMYIVRDRGKSDGRIIQIDRDEVSAIVLDPSTASVPLALATPAATPLPDL